MKEKTEIKNYSFSLIVFTIVLNIIGILAVGSAKPSLQTKQIGGMIVGVIIMIVISIIDYAFILKFY